ncbi:MAG TPA: methylenetetrahydrofolate reductase [NAD(P)H] [Thermoleophilaceae bacterium]|jgi:methylenetetrahydrofolate reductase (NADPH)|nr:methylenetetrahydrofolate reductase [NAD(P)H] [Thermoleophilaceae bacterium]
MRIEQILDEHQPAFSFEFFPPKTPEGEANLRAALDDLKDDQPAFVSVTYGAGGSTREKTVEIVKSIKQDYGIEAMAHLSLVGQSVDGLRRQLDEIADAGIDNVLALRGDPPAGETEWLAHPEGLHYSVELIELIKSDYDFCVGAACFPEVHPDAPSLEEDLRYLKRKVDTGATFLITQLFFDNQDYFNFVDEARAACIEVPIIPGIWPVTNYTQIKRIAELCKSRFPDRFERELGERKDDLDAVADLGVAYAALQSVELLARGAPGIHYYTLNKSPATRAILAALRSWMPAVSRA